MADSTSNQLGQFLIRYASLRQIQVFESVARNLSFTRAAEELHLTQPTVSGQVKSLADAIGLPLYEQLGRNIFLTEVGEAVVISCREIINSLSNLEIKLDDFRGMKRGRLRVAVVSTAKYFIPLALGEFCKKYPDIELSLHVGNRNSLLKRLNQNLDDIYILGQIPQTSFSLEVVPFTTNPLVIIANRENELVGQKVTLEQLADQFFIMREEGSGIRSAVVDAFSKKGLEVNERLTMQTNEAIKHCVVGDLGVACVSEHTLYLEDKNGPLVELDVEGFPIKKSWNIVYPSGKELSLIANEFLDFLKAREDEYIKL
ncbi:LysR family transcriptional regulator [Thiomicrorhabdus lithotrophica]|uniref:LysR substrate-binding domain-containing protein n=1 Tax=Thiomicrorhabdus lithotrophica TaxID=2949997 RepID=A0ABY8CAF6_9GAMM|nr:LysR family transcriptional regulator [Thiomicrorhabdus lithotrophica]WEJ62963.1 LysR substrate-binding domain-containing protein [Thiomicrorhabdus lithotrophica]